MQWANGSPEGYQVNGDVGYSCYDVLGGFGWIGEDGEPLCRGTGKVTITASALDGSNKKAAIQITVK